MDVTVAFPISFRYDGTWRCEDVGKSEKQITEDIFQHTELCSKSNTLTVLTVQGKKSADKLGLGLTYLINVTCFILLSMTWVEVSGISIKNCWFSLDVTKFQTSELLLFLRFYFQNASEQLKTNIHTTFHSEWVLGLVIDYA